MHEHGKQLGSHPSQVPIFAAHLSLRRLLCAAGDPGWLLYAPATPRLGASLSEMIISTIWWCFFYLAFQSHCVA